MSDEEARPEMLSDRLGYPAEVGDEDWKRLNTPKRYRMHRALVEAMLWNGANTSHVMDWILRVSSQGARWQQAGWKPERIALDHRNGNVYYAYRGDYITCDRNGECTPITADDFSMVYEPDPAPSEASLTELFAAFDALREPPWTQHDSKMARLYAAIEEMRSK